MMITSSMDFFFPSVKNQAMRRLLNARFAILNIAISVWLLKNCRVIYKTNLAFIRTTLQFFKQQHEYFCNQQIPFNQQSETSLL